MADQSDHKHLTLKVLLSLRIRQATRLVDSTGIKIVGEGEWEAALSAFHIMAWRSATADRRC